MIFVALQSKTGSASSTSVTLVFSDKLAKNDSRVRDPFDDDFDIEDQYVSQSNVSSASASSSAFDDQFPMSASQSQCSLAFSAGS